MQQDTEFSAAFLEFLRRF